MEGPLAEPTTMLTDYLLAAFAAAWGGILWRRSRRRGVVAMRWWAGGFYAIAGAALLGGSVHGYRPILDPVVERVMWTGTLWSIGLFAFCAVGTAARSMMPPREGRRAIVIGAVALAAYFAWTLFDGRFVVAIAAYGVGLAVLVVPTALADREGGGPRRGAPWIVAGVAVTGVGSVIQQAGLAPHPHFNHNDLFHVIQVVAMGFFYRAGRLLTDR